MPRFLVALALVAVFAGSARADDDETLTAEKLDPAQCGKETPPAPTNASAAPVTWSDFEIEGTLPDGDKPESVRALFAPTMQRHRALTDDARDDIKRIALSFGLYVVGISTKDTPAGTIAVIHLAPLPMVRRIDVDVNQSLIEVLNTPLFEDEIKRRIRLRIGSYLPWAPIERGCDLLDEQHRIEDYLRDEGYFEAKATVRQKLDGNKVTLKVKVSLGPGYRIGDVHVLQHPYFPISDKEITDQLRRPCHWYKVCFSTHGLKRFRRNEMQEDVQKIVDTFHKLGYPAVRVRTDFDPLTSFDRRSQTVRFLLTIDLRRKLDVVFEGIDDDVAKESELRDQLTFDKAASFDDVEANESAQALTAYLQNKGYFDAKVTWWRERLDPYDRIVFRIAPGSIRNIADVEFVGNKQFTNDQLLAVVGTKKASATGLLLGASSRATSEQLANDVAALVGSYREAGYRDVRVRVAAATSELGLGSAALAAGLAAVDHGSDLFVRFTIDEGLPTMLTQVQIELGDGGDALDDKDEEALCTRLLGRLADLFKTPSLARTTGQGRCVAVANDLKFQEQLSQDVKDQLRDGLYGDGRPRSKVAYESRTLGPRRVAVTYKVTDFQPLTIGKVILRGNFRTDSDTIRHLLRLDEGKPLTKDALAEAARRLRNTGLFDAVNVAMPDLENISAGSVNAVVEVAERYDYFAQVDVEAGYSSYNGAFVTLAPGFKNILGRGISWDLRGTLGFDPNAAYAGTLKLKQLAAESTLRFPQFLIGQYVPESIAFQGEFDAFHRIQDTPRFGLITTDGVTVSALRTWQRQRTATKPARAVTFGPHYDFRLRDRSVDVLRPLGADDDETQVPISTRTGSFGLSLEVERRVDRRGVLSPLAPEAGFRFGASASIASTWLGGQDTFLKFSAVGTKYFPIGTQWVLRTDLRYDQGVPLGGAVLLPEVERFFAGGDSTVRGYEDDRLATEVIQVGVPPLGNVSQIRVLPAGGNIRAMGSIDLELRIWKVFATGVFADAGMITNQWSNVTTDDIRPSAGVALLRLVTPFGSLAIERAVPLRPQLGDNPRGRFHVSFAARAQF